MAKSGALHLRRADSRVLPPLSLLCRLVALVKVFLGSRAAVVTGLNGTAGLPSAPEMLSAPRQLRLVPIATSITDGDLVSGDL